ncbi:inositol monophosphatase [Streptomyces sp. WMMC500]|uniref:inositol monophosphatase family protein n=1 Tax=Streptomyces sp. WMMC500 TaxID=3015154 RepID=UPI00248CEFF9|nr:inositol monophosphatase family protein [Streptomyces sp. WMMC500]WBB63665.1 inositol monophosphatase [Streptomyces sp. WMMC500]
MTDLADLLKIADGAVELAKSIIVSRDPGEITAKGDRDMASEVDFAVEAAVRDHLARMTPDITFLGEEEGKSPKAGRLMWALDPVDGTANFVRGIPLCCVSLGLFDGKRCVLGVVDLPFMDARYHAREGGGAYCGSRRIRASGTSDLSAAIVSLGDYAVGADALVRNEQRLALTGRLAGRVQRVRMWGTAALDLVWVAEGRTDACVILSNNPWDTSAGVVIAREAGARVVSASGSAHDIDSGETIAVTPGLLHQIIPLVREQ